VEIGVHHARYLIAMACMLRPDERAAGFDVFEEQRRNVDGSGKGDKAIAQDNLSKHLTPDQRVDLITADSLELSAMAIREKGLRNARIFSVDGGHTDYHTVNDIRIAQDTIGTDGVIVVDDFYNADWPGVAEGCHRFFILEAARKVLPVAYGDNKLYLVRASEREKYMQFFGELAKRSLHHKRVSLWGHTVFHLRMPELASAA